MFLLNKYSSTYFKIVALAKSRPAILGYKERHHVIPKCMGGTNDRSNLIDVTAREHYVMHLLLTKMVTGENLRSMAFALSMFNTNCKNHTRHKPPSRWYSLSRRLLSEARKGVMPSLACRLAVSKAKLGKPISDGQKKKLSVAMSKSTPFYAFSPYNERFVGGDLRNFCSDTSVSYNTVIKRMLPTVVITAGRNKGWVFSKNDIQNIDETRTQAISTANSNRSKALKEVWKTRNFLMN